MRAPAGPADAGSVTRHGRRLIYFSSVAYASYAQRPHFMVSAFVNRGFDSVLWIDPYPTRLPRLSDLKRGCFKKPAPAQAGHEAIRVVRPAALPIEPLAMSGFVNRMVAWRTVRAQLREFARTGPCVLAIGRPSKLAEWALKHVPHDYSFVDVLDNFPAFYRGLSRASMRTRLRAVCQKATDVYCSSSRLALDLSGTRPDAVVVPNGYPVSSLPAFTNTRPKRCIGYTGTIAQWFDWPLVRALAVALHDVTIRLIGPEFVARPTGLPPNIEFLGELPYDDIPDLVSEFAVGIIPFRITDLTSGVDPIKFYEYRSMGIPVWSTAFGEMKSRNHREGVTHISRESDWQGLWEQSRAIAVNSEEIASFRAEVDWNKRFENIFTRCAEIVPALQSSCNVSCHPSTSIRAERPTTSSSILTDTGVSAPLTQT